MGFRPPPLPSSVPLFPPRPHGRPLYWWPPCWLDLTLLHLTPVCRTCGAQVRCFWTCRRWNALVGSPHHLHPPPYPSLRSAPPLICPSVLCCRRWIIAPWLLGRWLGFRPLPPAPVRPPPVGPVTLWGILGFHPPWAPLPFRGCQRPEATRLPHPLHGGPPEFICHSRGRAAPIPLPHSVGLGVKYGGLAVPIVFPHSRGFCSHFFPPVSSISPFPLTRSMGAPSPRLVGGRTGGFPFVSPVDSRVHL